ncbi:hypothetical protein E8E12_004850 [Didymella heteroderae]|uniref:Uncharacterized protein n=1 Tax=Didymella heteroderae TaxID=1769908 RepID=A0A9P4WVM2_9PLEO|nr:hypothetical protein E8E12_004850 [Didymella heteroderae]
MPGLGDSRWASKPASSKSEIAPAPESNKQAWGFDEHVSIPAFSYTPPSAPASKTPPPHSAAATPSAPSNTLAPPRSTPKLFQKAEIAGKAAAKRMEELQGVSNTLTKPFLYQNCGYPPDQSSTPARSTATSCPQAPTQGTRRQSNETAEEKRARLNKLFNTWTPYANEFYNIYESLDLTPEEVKGIQDEIVRYSVNTPMVAGKPTSYRTEWETIPARLPPQRHGEGSAVVSDEEDSLGLGLPRAIAEGRHAEEVNDLMD